MVGARGRASRLFAPLAIDPDERPGPSVSQGGRRNERQRSRPRHGVLGRVGGPLDRDIFLEGNRVADNCPPPDLYSEARLQVRRRRRKKVPLADRQPLVRPQAPNQVWSADFVFDRTAEGRVLKCLAIVDDATTEAVAVVAARALGGLPVTRGLEALASTRGLPQVLRTDNGLEFCGRAMLTWAHARGVTLRLIEPGKPTRNAYVESFNGRFRDECLKEHWFTSVAHAQAVIETWRREYNEERPKKGLGGLTPAAYARTLTATTTTAKVTAGL